MTKGRSAPGLYPDHPRHQDAGESCDDPARLEDKVDIPVARHPSHHGGIGVERRDHVADTVGDAEAATEIDAGYAVAARAQVDHQRTDALVRGLQRSKIVELAADVERDPDQIEAIES
ncbi:hypothetical protein C8J41_1011166 [Sphingomonas sp. PP-CC-3G-468]|nr:hypothetical protein C8J41_1011166 [Sphingomonas sp. PP-CC-3G-468]